MSERITVREEKTLKPDSPLSVLVIDPNPDTRHRLKDTLRGLEYIDRVFDRGSPHHLLDILAENPVDVILFDEDPGSGNVFDIVRVVRTKAVAARTKIVLMGEHIDEETVKKGNESGIGAFLVKPYDIRGVEEALATVVGSGEDELHTKAREGLRETLDKLRQVSLFSGFSDAELVRLLKICRTRNYAAGKYIFHEGEKGISLYVLVAGKLEIRKKSNGEDRVLVEMSPGDCFGEMAIIDDEPRMADAVAATDCTVIEVNESVVNSNSDVLSLKLVRQIAILLAKKLRKRG